MRTIESNVTVNYYRRELKDVLTQMPNLNALKEYIEQNRLYVKYKKLPIEERDKYHTCFSPILCLYDVESLYNLLISIGFVSNPECDCAIKELELKLKDTSDERG